MSALLIVANLDSYESAAQHMAGASGHLPTNGLPSLGDAEAEDAIGHFAGAISGYHAGLCDAAAQGARSLHGYVLSFRHIGA